MSVSNPPALAATDLTVRLGDRVILDRQAFRIEPGAFVALLGPNGSGKTTLLRTLGGLLPFGGRLDLQGRPFRSFTARERARAIAFVRQQPSLDFDFSVEEFVALGRSPHIGWLAAPTEHDRRVVRDALAETDLPALADRLVSTLSGGEQQRVLLAQALAQATPLLLLDEPTAHLDVHHQYDLIGRVATLARDGRTVVAALHDLAFAARFADRVLVLSEGRIAADGPPEAVLTRALIRDVFRMDAEVDAEPGALRVRYLAPV